MVRALVLVKVTSASVVNEFVGSVRGIDGVVDAIPVFGRFDVAIFTESRNFSEISDVAKRIRQVKGIRSTETLPEAF